MSWLVAGALAVTALVVSVAYWVASTHKETPVKLPQSVPIDIHQQLSGYTVTHSDGARRIYTVHAARTVSFKLGGSTVLDDVLVELFGRTGNRHDIMRTQRCEYNSQNQDLFASGPVQIEMNAPPETGPGVGSEGKPTIHLETSQVSYRHEGSLMVTDQEVRFRVGQASGTAQGMAYATKEGWLELNKNVVVDWLPPGGATLNPPLRLTASRLRYDKLSRQIVIWGPVQATQGNRTVSADSGKVFLNGENRVARAELDGNTKALDFSSGRRVELSTDHAQGDFDPASGALVHLSAEGKVASQSQEKGNTSRLMADAVELGLAGVPARLQSGDASGNVQLMVQSSPSLQAADLKGGGPRNGQTGPQTNPAATEKKRLSTSELKFSFRPDGKSLKDAETVGPGRIVVDSADAKSGQRIITAGQFLMAFNAQSDLEALRGRKPTHIVFLPPRNALPGSTAKESTADQLLATFAQGTHALKEVRQSGNFTFRDADRNAKSDDSVYVAAAQGLTLTGRPQVWDAQTRMKCERLYFDLGKNTAEGTGKVQGSHLEAGDRAADGRVPDPTNVLADHMVAQQLSQVVHYEGNVRAWRGADVVESSSLDVYRTAKRLSSGSQVLTSHLQPASYAGNASSVETAQHETRPLTVRADWLDYFDEGSKASYRGHVKLQAETTSMEADKMDVYFSRNGPDQASEVERAMATGHVVVVQPGRRASSEQGEYFAGPGKIVLTGGPPTLSDVQKGFTTGQRLTLFVHDDRLVVDGGDGAPSLSEHRIAP
jgi:lipopolysaccharide export system protein LptA